MDIHFRSIGKIHVKATDAEVREKGDVEGELEIDPSSPRRWMGSMVIRTFS